MPGSWVTISCDTSVTVVTCAHLLLLSVPVVDVGQDKVDPADSVPEEHCVLVLIQIVCLQGSPNHMLQTELAHTPTH